MAEAPPMKDAPNQIHGHEVIAMMMTANEPFTRESLAATIREKFGADTRFYTCSANNLTPEELIAFLEERGKFVPRGSGFNVDPARVCRH